ncbi:MAG: 50S ribosomal protein L16 [Planctomycetota bacterium]|nr:50S ribosomal protein L16 [Planctomycetota bacterium]MDI6788297.1 50S ribosomal protein L16 [Planctomycetota bacterium]
MLTPKRIKYRKWQRGNLKGAAQRGNYVAFGEYGLLSLETGWLSAQQIEAGRVAISHLIPPTGKFWIRVFPHKPITAKPAETRMGTGKGEPEYYAAEIKKGAILYEIDGVTEDIAKKVFNSVAHKMPFTVKMVKRIH